MIFTIHKFQDLCKRLKVNVEIKREVIDKQKVWVGQAEYEGRTMELFGLTTKDLLWQVIQLIYGGNTNEKRRSN